MTVKIFPTRRRAAACLCTAAKSSDCSEGSAKSFGTEKISATRLLRFFEDMSFVSLRETRGSCACKCCASECDAAVLDPSSVTRDRARVDDALG